MRVLVLSGVVCAAILTALSAPAAVIYVDRANTSGVQDGASWATAFRAVQDAIDAADPATFSEVWVAAGTYDELRTDPDGALIMRSNVDLYGGFSGTETLREERDWDANVTIIDGSTARKGYPASVVIRAASNVLDGFTIQGAGPTSNSWNVALYIREASPHVRNCRFRGSGPESEAVDASANCAPVFINCEFHHFTGRAPVQLDRSRVATFRGCSFRGNGSNADAVAGIEASAVAYLLVDDCVFEDLTGTAVYLLHSRGQIQGSRFERTSSTNGTVRTNFAPLRITDCVFLDNTTRAVAYNSAVVIERTIISGNTSTASGTLTGLHVGSLIMANCQVTGNTGRTVHATDSGAVQLLHCTVADNVNGGILAKNVTVQNSIVREPITATSRTVTYSALLSSLPGLGNITADPLFADPANGDYNLTADSPSIDAAEALWVPGPSLNGIWQPSGAAPDMGAYEFLQGENGDGITGEDDTDGDGIPDLLEVAAGLNPYDAEDADRDDDGDGLTNHDEIMVYGTDPLSWDTDRDGMRDGVEVAYGLDPTMHDALDDADGDGLPNGYEVIYDIDPTDPADPPQERFVKLQGDDYQNLGAADSPWRTITRAMTAARIYTAGGIYGLGARPVNVSVGAGIYPESVVFGADVTLAGAGQGATVISGVGQMGAESFVLYGADNGGLYDCTVRLPGVHGFVTTLLRIHNVNMHVAGVDFVGNDNLFSIGLLIDGEGSFDTLIEDCQIRRLHFGVHAIDTEVELRDNTFEAIRSDAIFVQPPLEKSTAAAVPFLGSTRVGESGNNVFRNIGGNFIINNTGIEMLAQNNDWGVYTRGMINKKIIGPVNVTPFIRGGGDGNTAVGCHAGSSHGAPWTDLSVVALVLAALAVFSRRSRKLRSN